MLRRLRFAVWDVADNKRLKKQSYIGYARDAASFADLERRFRVRIPPALRAFYGAADGFRLEWTASQRLFRESFRGRSFFGQEAIEIWGCLHFYSLEAVLGTAGEHEAEPWKGILWFGHPEERDTALLRTLRPFDMHDAERTSCACFRVLDGEIEDTVYFHDMEDGTFDMEMGFAEYLERALASKGLMNWQRAHVLELPSWRADLQTIRGLLGLK